MNHRLLVTSALSALFLVLPRVASAAECAATTCPTGYECIESIAPCAALPCAEGEACEPCDTVIVPQCRPLPCTSDDECAEGMQCVTREVTECSGGAAPCADPGDDGGAPDCPEPEPEECTTHTESGCLPSYMLPCTQASDCGPAGFTCEPVEECSCPGSPGSAGTPTPGMDGGAAEPAPADDEARPADGGATPPLPECTCTPTGENFCQVTTKACNSVTVASDCPAGWTCGENPEGSCWSGPEGSGCEPADPAMICIPPYADVTGGGRGEGSDSGSGEVPTDNPGDGTPPPTSASGGTSGQLVDDDELSEPEAGGCALGRAPGPSNGALAALVLSALGLIVARRKRA